MESNQNNTQQIEIDLFPFVVECLCQNKKIYKDIDRFYHKRKYEFYTVAKNHYLYNHQIATEKSFLQEKYFRKALGILSFTTSYKDIIEWLEKVIQKGWPKAYSYISCHKKISIDEFLDSLIKSPSKLKNLTDTEINSNIIMLLFLSMNNGIEIIEDKNLKILLKVLNERKKLYSFRLGRKEYADEKNNIENKIKNIKNRIEFKSFNDMSFRLSARAESIGFIFDMEEFSFIDVIDDIKLKEKDFEEILTAYLLRYNYNMENPEKNNVRFIKDYVCDAIYIKYLVKAYKKAKKIYFENDEETAFIEMGLMQQKLRKEEEMLNKKDEILKLKEKELSGANKYIEKIEKENLELKKELETKDKNEQELNALREFIFNLDKQEEFQDNNIIDLDKLKKEKAVLIGGHEKWQSKMKEFLPNFIFISPDSLNYDTKVLDDINIIFICIKPLSHAMYYKTINAIKHKDKKIVYINQQNENIVLKTIYNAFYVNS